MTAQSLTTLIIWQLGLALALFLLSFDSLNPKHLKWGKKGPLGALAQIRRNLNTEATLWGVMIVTGIIFLMRIPFAIGTMAFGEAFLGLLGVAVGCGVTGGLLVAAHFSRKPLPALHDVLLLLVSIGITILYAVDALGLLTLSFGAKAALPAEIVTLELGMLFMAIFGSAIIGRLVQVWAIVVGLLLSFEVAGTVDGVSMMTFKATGVVATWANSAINLAFYYIILTAVLVPIWRAFRVGLAVHAKVRLVPTLVAIAGLTYIFMLNVFSSGTTFLTSLVQFDFKIGRFSLEYLLTALEAGIAEELLVRVLMFGALFFLANRIKPKMRLGWAITIASVLFGLMHVPNLLAGASVAGVTYQVIYATTMGVLFAAMYLTYGSILLPIAYHAANDYIAFVLSDSTLMTNDFTLDDTLSVGVISLLQIGVAIFMLHTSRASVDANLARLRIAPAVPTPAVPDTFEWGSLGSVAIPAATPAGPDSLGMAPEANASLPPSSGASAPAGSAGAPPDDQSTN